MLREHVLIKELLSKHYMRFKIKMVHVKAALVNVSMMAYHK
jgi:hypothetical protein